MDTGQQQMDTGQQQMDTGQQQMLHFQCNYSTHILLKSFKYPWTLTGWEFKMVRPHKQNKQEGSTMNWYGLSVKGQHFLRGYLTFVQVMDSSGNRLWQCDMVYGT